MKTRLPFLLAILLGLAAPVVALAKGAYDYPTPTPAPQQFHPVVTATTVLGFTANANSNGFVNMNAVANGTYFVYMADGITVRGTVVVTGGVAVFTPSP